LVVERERGEGAGGGRTEFSCFAVEEVVKGGEDESIDKCAADLEEWISNRGGGEG